MRPRFPPPFDSDVNRFLVGPDCLNLDIDRIFAKTLDQIIGDYEHEPGLIAIQEDAPNYPSLIRPSLVFKEAEVGIWLCDRDIIVGAYIGCDLSVLPEYQGFGLGAELVLERCIRDGYNPVWHLDSAAYSPAGAAAHRTAHRMARGDVYQLQERYARRSGKEVS